MRVWSDYVIIDLIVFAGHKVLCFKQNLGGRFSNRYIWGIIDAKGIVSGSSKCYILILCCEVKKMALNLKGILNPLYALLVFCLGFWHCYGGFLMSNVL